MNNKPLISVIMGIKYRYDDLYLLKRSIFSILHQSYENIELIICENGSTKEAQKFLLELSEKEKKIRLIDGINSDTLSAKLNRCISISNGLWIARMDDDDYSEPERLEKQYDFLMLHPEISFVGSNVTEVQDYKPVSVMSFPEFPQVKDFLFSQPYRHPAMLFTLSALKSVNGYSENAKCAGCEDYDLLLRLYEKGFLGANIQEPLVQYTIPSCNEKRITLKTRINEVYTRWERFKSLGLIPRYVIYVVKPLVVCFIPLKLLSRIKSWFYRKEIK